MQLERHFRALERMYLAGPINKMYDPLIIVSEGRAEIEIKIHETYFHSAGAVHGCVYFKMLDDAAFFAANSLRKDCFVLTKAFTTRLLRPVSSGRMKSIGKVVGETKRGIQAEAVVYDGDDRKIGKGEGLFVRGRTRLADALGYSEQEK